MTDFRFVKETPDGWIYEGLAIPYGGVTKAGQDLTGSHFTKDTDLCLEWFPSEGRPLLYRHGFDPNVKAAPVGREIAFVKEDDKGRWYQIQVDKAKEYAAEVRQLAEEGLLSLSSGAVDHLTQIAAKTGEIIRWPWVELSFVPNPAHPEALVYPVKSVDAIAHLTIVDTLVPDAIKGATADADISTEGEITIIAPGEQGAAVRGWLPDGTTPGDLDNGDFAWISSDGKIRKLPYKIHGKVDEAGWRAAWTRAHQAGTDFSGGPSRASVIRKLLRDKPAGIEVAGAKDAGEDAEFAAATLSNIICLLSEESDEPDQAALIRTAFTALSQFLAAEVAEIGTPEEIAEEAAEAAEAQPDMPVYGYLSVHESTKAGARNSAADAASLLAAHDNIASVLSLDCASGSMREAPPAPRLVITGTAAAKAELTADDKAELARFAALKAKELLRVS